MYIQKSHISWNLQKIQYIKIFTKPDYTIHMQGRFNLGLVISTKDTVH